MAGFWGGASALAAGADAALAAEGRAHGRLADAVQQRRRDAGRVEVLGGHEALAVGLHEELEGLLVFVRQLSGLTLGFEACRWTMASL